MCREPDWWSGRLMIQRWLVAENKDQANACWKRETRTLDIGLWTKGWQVDRLGSKAYPFIGSVYRYIVYRCYIGRNRGMTLQTDDITIIDNEGTRAWDNEGTASICIKPSRSTRYYNRVSFPTDWTIWRYAIARRTIHW